jgi:antitoxin (DNA-binding transcriptional repressor) of toxin-antitoxin stability system
MEKATISQLKNRLSEFLRKVRAGQTVVVFDRSQPIARIERIEGKDDAGGRLARLQQGGLLRRAPRQLRVEALRAGAPKAKESVEKGLTAGVPY